MRRDLPSLLTRGSPLLAGAALGLLCLGGCGARAGLPSTYHDILACSPGEVLTAPLAQTDSGDAPVPGKRSDLAEKAHQLVGAKDWPNALPLLQRVARGEGQDDRGNVQLAGYELGVAYYHLHHGELAFEQMKPIALDLGHLKHREALVWMANLSLVVPTANGVPSPEDYVYLYGEDELRFYDTPQYRDLGYLLFYLRGRGAYRRGQLLEAMQTMAIVERYGPYKTLTEECDRLATERLRSEGPPPAR